MKRIRVTLYRMWMAAVAGLLLVPAAGTGAAYANPPLGTQLGRLDVGQDVAVARADAAIREAGLTPYPAGSLGSRLGTSDKFTVSIQTMAEGGATIFSVAVAGSESTSNEDAFRLRDFLVNYLRTGFGGIDRTVPNLGGTWYREGNPALPATVNQTGNSLSFTNENGQTSRGRFESGGVVIAEEWEGGLRGKLNNGRTRIDWANGTSWQRRDGTGTGVDFPVPNIGGTWYREGNTALPATVRQTGSALTFTNEYGQASRGRFESPTVVVAEEWEGGLRGKLNSEGTRIDWANGTSWQRRVGTGTGGGICDDPRTMAIMDEWLSRAIPPQEPGESLRYEGWGRLVGRSRTADITVSGPPDTPLSRCAYLWERAARLQSTNGMGTLREYVEQRRR